MLRSSSCRFRTSLNVLYIPLWQIDAAQVGKNSQWATLQAEGLGVRIHRIELSWSQTTGTQPREKLKEKFYYQ